MIGLADLLKNPQAGGGAQPPAPDPPLPRKQEPETLTEAASRRGPAGRSARVAGGARVCVTYGRDEEMALFYVDDPNDYEKVVEFELYLEDARDLIAFIRELAEVRVLHPDLREEPTRITRKKKRNDAKSKEAHS